MRTKNKICLYFKTIIPHICPRPAQTCCVTNTPGPGAYALCAVLTSAQHAGCRKLEKKMMRGHFHQRCHNVMRHTGK